MCYVALGPDTETATSKPYEFPDGQVFNIKNERFRCPEILFNPSLIGREGFGVHQLAHQTIMKVDIDVKHIVKNIVISGGNTMFEGFGERLEKEITTLIPYGRLFFQGTNIGMAFSKVQRFKTLDHTLTPPPRFNTSQLIDLF